MNDVFFMEHARQFVDLWILLRDVHLDDSIENEIVWKFMASGKILGGFRLQIVSSLVHFVRHE